MNDNNDDFYFLNEKKDKNIQKYKTQKENHL